MRIGLSQEAFAQSFGFTIEQIRAWKQGRNRPVGGLRAYLMMIDLDPEIVLRNLESARKSHAA
jgi:putative transcriptional regulator